MKAKRWISLLLAVSMVLGVLAMPASAAAQQPESTAVVSEELPDAAALSAAEDENDIVNIRIRATGNLVYGSDYKLEVETRPENTQYIAPARKHPVYRCGAGHQRRSLRLCDPDDLG